MLVLILMWKGQLLKTITNALQAFYMKQDVGDTVCASAKHARITLPFQACFGGIDKALTQLFEERCVDSYSKASTSQEICG